MIQKERILSFELLHLAASFRSDAVQRPGYIPLLYMYQSFPVQRDDMRSKYYSVNMAVNKWNVSNKRFQKGRTNSVFFFIVSLTLALSPLLTFRTMLFFHYFVP